jgi:hypothetical protein
MASRLPPGRVRPSAADPAPGAARMLARSPITATDAFKAALDDMQERAGEALRSVIETGADLMVSAPWRIVPAVYGRSAATHRPPVDGKTIYDLYKDCRQKIKAERARRDHWSFDPNRLIALRQAERALERMLLDAPG